MNVKRQLVVLALLVAVPAVSAYAGPIVGQRITLGYGDSHYSNGGEFKVTGPASDPYTFETFCVETTEYFTPGQQYYIGSISTKTMYGNLELNNKVAYLYSHFRAENLKSGYNNSDNGDAGLLQSAIWAFMSNPNYVNAGNKYVVEANTYAAGFGLGDVAVLNLFRTYDERTGRYSDPAQDQLALVPEPASMLLLGTGLVGLAGAVRRRFKK